MAFGDRVRIQRLIARAKGTANCPRTLEHRFTCWSIVYPERTPMRTKKPSAWLQPSVLFGLASHTAMGIAMGLAFAFVLTLIDRFGDMALIDHSADPKTTMIVFVGSFTLAFGVGATLTGFVFMMMEDR
jgi:hypothetical protein